MKINSKTPKDLRKEMVNEMSEACKLLHQEHARLVQEEKVVTEQKVENPIKKLLEARRLK